MKNFFMITTGEDLSVQLHAIVKEFDRLRDDFNQKVDDHPEDGSTCESGAHWLGWNGIDMMVSCQHAACAQLAIFQMNHHGGKNSKDILKKMYEFAVWETITSTPHSLHSRSTGAGANLMEDAKHQFWSLLARELKCHAKS